MEPLPRLFEIATDAGVLAPVPDSRASLRASLFADDAMLFLSPVREQMVVVKEVLEGFSAATGLAVNFSKSAAIPIRCDELDLVAILEPLGAQVQHMPCKYLGLPLSLRRLRKIDFQPLIDKIASRLTAWKLKLISLAGRLVLLKTVLSALPIFFMICIPLSKWVIEQIDKLRRAWLWTGTEICSGGHCKVAWNQVCRPIKFGGLGILNPRKFSLALRMRWLWLAKTAPLLPWLGMDLPCSLGELPFFASSTTSTVGDGAVISFWNDTWGDLPPPCQLWPNLHALSRRKNRSLQDALRDGAWIRNLQGRVTAPLLDDFVALRSQALGVALTAGARDGFRWRAASGQYSSSDAYLRQFQDCVASPLHFAWTTTAPPRCMFFLWLLLHRRLSTADRLLRHGIPNDYFCALCNHNLETPLHLFGHCNYAKAVWTRVATAARCPWLAPVAWPPTEETADAAAWALHLILPPMQRRRTASIAVAVLWALWKERCCRVFQRNSRPASELANAILEELQLWLLAGAKHLVYRE